MTCELFFKDVGNRIKFAGSVNIITVNANNLILDGWFKILYQSGQFIMLVLGFESSELGSTTTKITTKCY